jgi:hypothetical protein
MQLPIADNPTVCRRLRAKGTPGAHYTPQVDFDDGYISSATFWCLATGDPVGPDDSYVHPHACVAGRACYCEPAEGEHAS